jgi:hypothetical protein
VDAGCAPRRILGDHSENESSEEFMGKLRLR